jgi:uncharacterized membrane protein YjfL (UPF0719 family)
MTTEIDPQSESSESRKRLKVLAAVLTTGVMIGLAAAIADARNPSGVLPTALGFVELLVCLTVIGTAVEMARERSPRKLFVIGLVIAATPFVLMASLEPVGSGGHDAVGFGVIYFAWASVASGVSLLVVAGVRFVIEQRNLRSSTHED